MLAHRLPGHVQPGAQLAQALPVAGWFRRSSSRRRLGSASALNTSSMLTPDMQPYGCMNYRQAFGCMSTGRRPGPGYLRQDRVMTRRSLRRRREGQPARQPRPAPRRHRVEAGGHADILRELIDGHDRRSPPRRPRRGDPRLAAMTKPRAEPVPEPVTEHALARRERRRRRSSASATRSASRPGSGRRPSRRCSRYLAERADSRGAPRPLGRDGQGRHVLEYVPGPVAMDQPPLDAAAAATASGG